MADKPSQDQDQSSTIRPVVGHTAAWGLSSSRFRVKPLTLSPGATDTLEVRVREKIDISGVGTDVVELTGTFTVRRDDPRPVAPNRGVKWGQARIGTEFRSLELHGESPVFGTVRVTLSPNHLSQGVVGPAERNSQAAKCIAEMHPVVELPDLNMTLNTGSRPVRLASKVVQVPPVGDVARSENSVALLDEKGSAIGEIISSDIEVGNIIASIPIGNAPKAFGLSLSSL